MVDPARVEVELREIVSHLTQLGHTHLDTIAQLTERLDRVTELADRWLEYNPEDIWAQRLAAVLADGEAAWRRVDHG